METGEARTSLKDDIDMPMRKVVGMLNLMGIHTVWSCCGFNYEDQPAHKSHDYGLLQVIVEKTPESLSLVTDMLVAGCPFSISNTFCAPGLNCLAITLRFKQSIEAWNRPESAHFHELGAQYIPQLEKYLRQPKYLDKMKAEILIVDTNETVRKTQPYWAYKPREPWLVRKEDVIV